MNQNVKTLDATNGILNENTNLTHMDHCSYTMELVQQVHYICLMGR